MKGFILTISTDGVITSEVVTNPNILSRLQEIVGGPIQPLPHFNRIALPSVLNMEPRQSVACVAYCDEEGLRKPVNRVATQMWVQELVRTGVMASATGDMSDVAKGTIAVVWGDKEFMALH